jgi:hypothetical protein
MLVQLDSGDIANLERLSLRCPAIAARVIDDWNDNDLILGLNIHHAQEIAQLEREESRQRRLDLLKRFRELRFGEWAEYSVIRHEVAVLIDAVGNGESPDFEGELRSFLFPASSGDAFEEYTQGHLDEFTLLRNQIEMTARVRNLKSPREGARSYKRMALGSRTTEDARGSLVADMEAAGIPVPERDLWMSALAGMSPYFEGQFPNVRRALEAHYGLAGLPITQKVPDLDLALVAGVYDIARELISEAAAGIPAGTDVAALLATLDPYRCPGIRLQFALQRAQVLSRQAEPAGETDRSHAVFAPYVDVAFVDRQTAGFLEQETRRHPELLPAADLRTVRRSCATTDLVRVALGAKKPNATV